MGDYIYIQRLRQRERERDFFKGVGSLGNGGREVPQSAVCKLEAQESQWCPSVHTQRLENLGSRRRESQSEGRR